jgi:hypothetical protein
MPAFLSREITSSLVISVNMGIEKNRGLCGQNKGDAVYATSSPAET